MKTFRLLFALTTLFCFSFALGQSRDSELTVDISTTTGESVEGLVFTLKHIEYSLTYPASETTLDANGHCVIKVYSGKHEISIEKEGFRPYREILDINGKQNFALELNQKIEKPYSLKATLDHNIFTGNNDVTFEWNKEEPAFFDDFESYKDFSIKFGEWTGIDGDLLAAAPLAGSYPNRGTLQYAQIINPMTVDPTWWYEYEVLRPYSGKQYVGFIRTNSGEANDDWLISPAITVGTKNILQFMAKAADVYKEKFEVAITEAENPTVNDFTIISAGNYETVSYQTWTAKKYDLSAYEGKTVKIAIHYIGEANRGGAFMLMIDDFFVGQEETATTAKARRTKAIDGVNKYFQVFLDGTKVGETTSTSYTFKNLTARENPYVLGVKAIYVGAESELVTTPLSIKPSDFAKVTFNVTTNNSVSPQDINIILTNKADGSQLTARVSETGKAEIAYLPVGEYLISIDSKIYEHFEKTLSVTGNTNMDISLKELIITPYNITANATANAQNPENIDLKVKWNQDLGFEDSFETYPDFATKFGEWTSIDSDQLPVYPIALGSQSNIITFPGSSSPSSPQPIAPMVFNPMKTVPSMQSDPAILAPTGDKSVIFFSAQGGQSDKWVISPLQEIRDGYIWKVTAKGYAIYPEMIEFCISSSKDLNTFTVIDKIELPYENWQIYSIYLSAYAGQQVYLAVHYIAKDAFLAQIDDFYVGPGEDAETVNVGNVINYNVTLDGKQASETKMAECTIANIANTDHTIGITANYASGKSETAFYNYKGNAGVESLENTGIKVIASVGEITVVTPQPYTAEIFNATGILVAKESADGYKSFSVSRGIYLVKIGSAVTKVIVK